MMDYYVLIKKNGTSFHILTRQIQHVFKCTEQCIHHGTVWVNKCVCACVYTYVYICAVYILTCKMSLEDVQEIGHIGYLKESKPGDWRRPEETGGRDSYF